MSPIPPEYELREVERLEEPRFTELLTEGVLGRSSHIPLDELRAPLSDEARALRRRRGMCRLGVYQGAALVAFSVGWQEFDDRFYMAASVVDPAHRRRGLYRALAEAVVERARAAGYSQVWSRHVATNNPILIAKLKLGFRITGVELCAAHGVMVHLAYALDPAEAEALDVRAGLKKAPGAWAEWLIEGAKRG